MSSWYYLVSQLPALPVDESTKLPITEEAFNELCGRFLDKKNMTILKELSLEPPRKAKKTGSDFVDGWYSWERSLRMALGTIRAQRMKKDFVAEDVMVPADVLQTVRTACGYDSPLEAEIFLNSARSRMMENNRPSDCFSTDAVFAYALQLKLASRIRKFNTELGMESYKKIYEQILEGSPS